MRVRLLVQHQSANVPEVRLKGETLVGRSTECNLRIASREVSRRHCRIRIGRSEVLIEDLGSANGTFVDGEQLQPNVPSALPPQSVLEIGPAKFVVQYDDPSGTKLDSGTKGAHAAALPPVQAPVPTNTVTDTEELEPPVSEEQFGDEAVELASEAAPPPLPAGLTPDVPVTAGQGPADLVEPVGITVDEEDAWDEEDEDEDAAVPPKKGGWFGLFGGRKKRGTPADEEAAEEDLLDVADDEADDPDSVADDDEPTLAMRADVPDSDVLIPSTEAATEFIPAEHELPTESGGDQAGVSDDDVADFLSDEGDKQDDFDSDDDSLRDFLKQF